MTAEPARPLARAFPLPSPAEEVAAIRQGTEDVFERTLTAMFDAMADLSRAEAALQALTNSFAPAELARLQATALAFQALACDLRAKVARTRDAAQRLEGLMREGQGRLDDLRRLTRAASVVALNAQVVSGAIRLDGGALDGLARTMRAVLAQVASLVAELAVGIDRGRADLARVTEGATGLQAFVDREAVPAIQRFAALIEARARDKALPRSAALVSTRLAGLQGRIRTAVMHLQAGDGFRQRMEHVEAILARAATPGPLPQPLLHRLAAEQMRGALADLRHALAEGRRSLRALGRTSGAIPQALAAGGLSGGDAGGLASLTVEAGRIERAIEGLRATGRSLSDASEGLSLALAGVGEATRPAAEFETRMTVLGLNAILLSSRMGTEGRAMVEVAQQLRDIARSITETIALLRADTEGISETAGRLDAPEDAALAARLAAAVEATAEVSALAQAVGRQLADMAEARSAADLAQAFGAADRDLGGFGAQTQALSALADRLDPPGRPLPPLPAGAEAAVTDLRRLYSMQGERDIHDALFPDLAPPPAAPAEQEEDDIFFA